MLIGKGNIVGLGKTEEDSEKRYSSVIETSMVELSSITAGKIFFGTEVLKQGDVSFGLFINDKEYEFNQNQKYGSKNLLKPIGAIEGNFFELPMRIIKPKEEYTIVIRTGYLEDEKPVWTGASPPFTLKITGVSPEVKYDPKKDSD